MLLTDRATMAINAANDEGSRFARMTREEAERFEFDIPTEVDAAATVWVDSNVMAEVLSQGDLFADQHRGPKLMEERRMMLQGSFWLAMVLDEQVATSMSYWYEIDGVISRRASPGSEAAPWTGAWATLLQPYVFPRWIGAFTKQGEAIPESECRNDQRDQLMVDLCRDHRLTLVSRDKGARSRAKRAGVVQMSPEEYAASSNLNREVARERFLNRLVEIGGLHYLAEVSPAEWGSRRKVLETMVQVYANIWEPPGLLLRYVLQH